jgi:dTDP-4-amino-4,6-dideoxygalactose transaminase
MDKIPFSPPHIDDDTLQEVVDTLRSGWITTGPRTKELERIVAKMSGVPKVLCVNSATAGMELMLRWFGVGPGDEVIVPAYTYCATANVVVHCGATPVMVDVLHHDGTIDPEAVASALSPRTKAIIPVDLGGMPADYRALQQVVAQADFSPSTPEQAQLGRPLLLADAAHSIGARYRRKPAASWPDVAVFSFHAVKNLTTAEGGAICLNLPASFNPETVYQRLNTSSLHGQNKDALAKFGQNSWEYDVEEPGYKCNMPDVLAAIGLVAARKYESETIPRRKAQFERYHRAFAHEPWAELAPFATAEKQSSCHLYLLRIRDIDLEQRNAIIDRIMQAGVSVNVHYKPLPLLTAYKDRGYELGDYPVCCDFWQREISLPVYFDLTDAAQDRVIQVVKQAVEESRSQFIPLPRFKHE